MSSTINIALFGIGNVGSTLIKQINALTTSTSPKNIQLFTIANSKLALFSEGIQASDWQDQFDRHAIPYQVRDVIAVAKEKGLQNLIAVDATASEALVGNYIALIENGFHIVTANKIANTLSGEFYRALRTALALNRKQFFYETNVGAGLPIIETLKSLYQSGERIHKIRGVFSGSLSYLFNTFSIEDKSFSEVLLEADALGLTEPDAREDLSGKDVARKLLILSRELGLERELSDVKVQSLVPSAVNGTTTLPCFRESVKQLDAIFSTSKLALKENEVLRHVGELDIAAQRLEVKLVQESQDSPLGKTQGADAIVEIYTESYGDQPLVIQGAGAGKEVTARGVLSDILRVTQFLN